MKKAKPLITVFRIFKNVIYAQRYICPTDTVTWLGRQEIHEIDLDLIGISTYKTKNSEKNPQSFSVTSGTCSEVSDVMYDVLDRNSMLRNIF